MSKLIILIISSLLICTGCAGAADQSELNDKCDTSSINNSKDDFRKTILNRKYDNITVADNFNLIIPEYTELGIYDVTFDYDFDDQSESLFSKYIPNYDKSKVAITNIEDNMKQVIYDDDNYFSIVTSIGGFVVSKKECLNRVLYGDMIPFIGTELSDIDSTNDYEIGSVKTSMHELISSSNNFISDFVETTHYPNQIVPFTFSPQRLDDGTIAGTMHCRSIYKGVPIFDLQSLHDEYSNKIAELTPTTCTFINGNDVGQFAVIYAFCDYKTVKLINNVISPDKAVELTSKKLSGHMDLELKYEELVYFPTCNENRFGGDNGNGNKPGDIIRLTPYWIIYFCTDWWHETFAIVNAVTGEIDFINNAK